MTRLERIESEISALSPSEVAELLRWFESFAADLWDRQVERDAANGKLDALAEKALRDHDAGRSSRL